MFVSGVNNAILPTMKLKVPKIHKLAVFGS
jgi:hypothetical protein